MKKITLIIVGSVIGLSIFITCGKDPEPVLQPTTNRPPVANAGKDTSITLPSCAPGTVTLDGRASSDPDNSFLTYSWKVLSSLSSYHLYHNDAYSPQFVVSGLRPGQYYIELTVIDPAALSAKDTVMISIVGAQAMEYRLDINITGSFYFYDNYEDCYYYFPCIYYDATYIDNASGSFSPIGTMNFYAWENADTSTVSTVHDTHFELYTSNNSTNPGSVSGASTVNFKKVFQSGGGAFNGTFRVSNGSASDCDPNIFASLPPLTVTGTLDTTAKVIKLNIKGQIYF